MLPEHNYPLGGTFVRFAEFSLKELERLLVTDKTTNLQLRSFFETGELDVGCIIRLRDLLSNQWSLNMDSLDIDAMGIRRLSVALEGVYSMFQFVYRDQEDGTVNVHCIRR